MAHLPFKWTVYKCILEFRQLVCNLKKSDLYGQYYRDSDRKGRVVGADILNVSQPAVV